MIRHDVKQGTREWEVLRLGIPTASNFHKIITPAGKPSSQAFDYVATLCFEWLLGYPKEQFSTGWTERGTELEGQAVRLYEFEKDVDVDRVGFVTRDDGKVGGSPDGFVGTDGGLELKTPEGDTHIGHLLNGGLKYDVQVQGLMYLTDREWWDIASFNPMFPLAVFRRTRDDRFVKALEVQLARFLEQLSESKEKLSYLKGNV